MWITSQQCYNTSQLQQTCVSVQRFTYCSIQRSLQNSDTKELATLRQSGPQHGCKHFMLALVSNSLYNIRHATTYVYLPYVYPALCIPRPVYTPPCVHPAMCIPCHVYYTLPCVHPAMCIPAMCIPCHVYTLPCVYPAVCIPCHVYTLPCVYPALYIPEWSAICVVPLL